MGLRAWQPGGIPAAGAIWQALWPTEIGQRGQGRGEQVGGAPYALARPAYPPRPTVRHGKGMYTGSELSLGVAAQASLHEGHRDWDSPHLMGM